MRVDKISRIIRMKVSMEMGLEDLGMVLDIRVRYIVMVSKYVMVYLIFFLEFVDSRNII